MYKISEEIQFIGRQVISLPKCRSTNDMAANMLKQNLLSDGSIIITDHQSSGRGQRGNTWNSEPNKNLTFSFVIKPSFITPVHNFHLNIITSLALIEAVKQPGFPKFKIKWPNDIMYDHHKLAGILIENSIQSKHIDNSIIGIGLNVNQMNFDETYKATSLKTIFKKPFNTNDILNRILIQFENTYFKLKNDGIEELKKKYISYQYWINEEHTFKSSQTFEGIITGIDDFGHLEVIIDGKKQKFDSKEIKYIK